MDQTGEDIFEIKIDFVPNEGGASRIFKTMAGLIDSISELDRHLLGAIDTGLGTSLVLDEVQAGSLKAILRNLLSDLPDEAIKNGEWKKIVGHYLLKAKYRVLKWCESRDSVTSRSDVRALESDLLAIAQETDVKVLPAYAPVPADQLLGDVRSIQESLEHLSPGDTAIFITSFGEGKFNGNLILSESIVRDVLTRDVESLRYIGTIQVKKPDYLGRSMWTFRYNSHGIEAKILDADWLHRFQSRNIDVRPGDSLKVHLKEDRYYDYEGRVLFSHFEIEQVVEVIRPPDIFQHLLP